MECPWYKNVPGAFRFCIFKFRYDLVTLQRKISPENVLADI